MRDLNDSETPIASSSPYNLGIENNIPLMAALGAFTVAQILKVFTYRLAERKWDFRRLVGSGGMPSSHTSLVVGLCTGVALVKGLSDPAFAIALCLALVVAYDACGVRLQAGMHAALLNQIVYDLPTSHPVSEGKQKETLKETLGHTPLQVLCGALTGILVPLMMAHGLRF